MAEANQFSGLRLHAQRNARSGVALIMAQVKRPGDAPGSGAISSAEFVRQVIAARAARREFFNSDLFADPAWDILLELFALRIDQHRTSVSKLCLAAGVPMTTALRWLDRLERDDLIEREGDQFDARRVWVSLSNNGYDAMEAYLAQLAAMAMPI